MSGLPDVSLALLITSLVALVAGGLVKGVTGIGLPLVAMPVLASFIPVPQAIVLLSVPSMATSIWQAFQGGYFMRAVKRLWLLLAGVALGVAISVRVLATIDLTVLYLLLGAIVVFYSSVLVRRVVFEIPRQAEPWAAPLTGLIAGLIGGVSMLFGPVYAMYLAGLKPGKGFFVAAVSLVNLASAAFLTVALAGNSLIGAKDLVASLIATVPVSAGLVLGQKLRNRINEELFRRALAVVLLLIGLNLLRKALA